MSIGFDKVFPVFQRFYLLHKSRAALLYTLYISKKAAQIGRLFVYCSVYCVVYCSRIFCGFVMSLNGVIIGFLPLYQALKLTNRFIPSRDISSFAGVLCIVCVFCDLILKPVFYAQNHAFLSVYVYTTTHRRSRQALFVTLWAVSCKMFPRGVKNCRSSIQNKHINI